MRFKPLTPFICALALATQAGAVNLTSVYTENFDAMGAAGTAPPSGWTLKQGAVSSGNTTWSSSVTTAGVAGMISADSAVLTASTAPTANNNNGYNAQGASAADRVLGTAPTGGAGTAIELTLTNTSGAAITKLAVGFDTRRYTVATTTNELPGYWLFYSLDDGTTWTNVSAINPTITTVPNTAGVTTQASTAFTLSSSWASNATLLLRWVDDNASQSSPDQVIGLDNVTIASNLALTFNGTSQYVTMGAATSTLGASTFTLECWFKRTGTGTITSTGTGGVTSAIPLVTKGRGEAENSNVDCNYFLGIDSTTNKLCADFESYGATGITAGQNYPIIGNTVISNNVWYHAAVTWNGASWTLYLNGAADGTSTPPTGAAPRSDSIQHFGIGSAFTSTGAAAGFFQGTIDEARVWSVARSASQILASRDLAVTGPVPGLLGRYGFGEGTGTTTSAIPATAPNGTLAATPVWSAGPPMLVNTAPTVALTTPTSGATAVAGSTVTLAATAADADGGVAKVEFYQGATLIGSSTLAPYSFDWTNVPAGSYSLTAKAIDYLGAVTTSSAITLDVVVNQPPTVSLTAPVDGTSTSAPATVNLAATASDADGTIAKVEFFSGATKLGEDTSAPFEFVWSNVPSADYTLTAKATDNLGGNTTSSAITLHVTPPATLPPAVSISSPAHEASYVAPASINITALATDTDGTVAKVEFFNGSTKLGEDTTAPFAFNWTGVAPGDYILTAKATDDLTATTISDAVTVHVLANQPPVVNLTAPANNATGIGSATSLNLSIADPEGDAQTVSYFGRRTAPAAPGADFSVIAIPDTQYYSENTARNPSSGGTGAVGAIFHAQTQWCVDNRTARNIAFVSHMGDIAQNGDAFESEWQVADAAMARVENPATTLRAHGLPWGGAPGNHDQQPIGDAGGATNYYNQYFHFTRWDKRPYYGGHFGTKGGNPANTNNYELFSASGLDFIIIHMEYDLRAKSFYQPVLDWADALLKAYPDRRAIITSHWIVNTGNPATFSTQGQDIYNDLKDNPNLFLMLCGHVNGEGQRADTFSGRTVNSILSDYQESKNGGNGFLRILTFKPSTNQIHVESYSPTLDRAVNASDSVPSWTAAYDLNYNMQSPVTDWIPLGTVNVQAGGTTAPLNWTGLEAGNDYDWYASVNDGTNAVTTGTRHFSTTPPMAPTVALTSPLHGASVSVGTAIQLTADASDADGNIVRVEFFDGGTKLGEDSTAPYTYAWNGATPGSHTITAVATDDSGLDAISAVATISVTNQPPVVALTSPDPGEEFNAPEAVFLNADATDADGTVSKVEYFANGTKVGEVTTAPYSMFWNNVYTSSYTITAKATDNAGAIATSAPVSITVTNPDNVLPSVAITSPTAGVAYAGTIAISASASDTDGTVSKVEFYNGATKLGESSTAPYTYSWTGVAVGSYTLTAKATDNDGGVTTSAGVLINVQAAPLSFSESFDSMGTGGTAPPSGWSVKVGEGGTKSTWTTSITPNGTTLSVASMIAASALTVSNSPTTANINGFNAQKPGGATTARVIATSPTGVTGTAIQWQLTNTSATGITAINVGYDTIRYTAVTAGSEEELPGYQLFYSLDSGSTWVNVAALNPALSGSSGIVVPNTTGVTTVPPSTITLATSWNVGATLLLRWVDDNAVTPSPDQIIGLDNVTLASAAALVGSPPSVAITAPLAGDTFAALGTVNITASASDSDGTVTKVEFYSGVTKLGESSVAPYSYSWTGVASGTYSLTARATDNDGNVANSSPISITVSPAPGSGTLSRAAYLQKAGPTTMTLRWRSSQSIKGRVNYGSAPASLTATMDESAAATDHEVTLTGLTPDTTYYYSVGSAFDTLEGGDSTHKFTTPPVAGSTPNTRIWVLGDAGTGSASQTSVRDAFYTWTGSRDPNLALELGDNAYNSGTDAEFQAKVFDIYGTMMRRVPFWSCLGNHETNQSTSFVDTYPYFSVYTFPKAGECGGVSSGTEHYYSFDYGNIHFISLDSMTASRSASGAMATWLTNDLASTTRPWIIAFFHHPPYTKGSHNSDTETELIEMRGNILPILEAGGVDLVLSGHSHCYERSYLLDGHYGLSGTLTAGMKKNAGNGRPAGNGAYMKPLTGPRDHFGAVYAVAGSSGQISGGSLNHPAHFVSLNNLGSMVLDVNGTRLDATFLRETGASGDTFTMIKQGPADSDGDGVSDEYELANGMNRFNPSDANTPLDGSGMTAKELYLLGIHPGGSDHYNWSTSAPAPTTGNIDVTFATLADRKYQVFWSADLITWSVGSTEIIGDGTVRTWTDDGAVTGSAPGSSPGKKRFYKVKVSAYP